MRIVFNDRCIDVTGHAQYTDLMYKPHEVWNDEVYQIILPRSKSLEQSLEHGLKDALNIADVQIEDGDMVLHAYGAWVIVNSTEIQIDFISFYYGKIEDKPKCK